MVISATGTQVQNAFQQMFAKHYDRLGGGGVHSVSLEHTGGQSTKEPSIP